MVNFNENSYTVAESGSQVNISLRIDGKFFVPVWAIIEIRNGTATGGLCKRTDLNLEPRFEPDDVQICLC